LKQLAASLSVVYAHFIVAVVIVAAAAADVIINAEIKVTLSQRNASGVLSSHSSQVNVI